MIEMILILAILVCLLLTSLSIRELQKQINNLQVKLAAQQIVFGNNQTKIEEFIKSLNRTFGEIDTELSQIRKELK